MKQLLVVVDMQNDFVTGALGTAEAQAIVDNVVRLCQAAVGNGNEVVFTRDTHGENYLSTQEGARLPVQHCIKGTWGWQIVDQLAQYATNVIDKPTFGSVNLAQYVKDGGFDVVNLVGLCTDICVISNAMLIKAYSTEAKVVVHANCCAGVTPASHSNALEAMKMCQIEVVY
ncbi:MAG: cysteine hydrolase [Clostridia bacterium]|nr:cysteine hydrolase [Clostridia bacterium]